MKKHKRRRFNIDDVVYLDNYKYVLTRPSGKQIYVNLNGKYKIVNKNRNRNGIIYYQINDKYNTTFHTIKYFKNTMQHRKVAINNIIKNINVSNTI